MTDDLDTLTRWTPVTITLDRGAAEYLRLMLSGLYSRQRAKCETQAFHKRPILKAEAEAKAYLLLSLFKAVNEAVRGGDSA
jgi:hypothetical protein